MDYLKSNYVYWKSLAPDSPSNSASEEEVSVFYSVSYIYRHLCSSFQCHVGGPGNTGMLYHIILSTCVRSVVVVCLSAYRMQFSFEGAQKDIQLVHDKVYKRNVWLSTKHSCSKDIAVFPY